MAVNLTKNKDSILDAWKDVVNDKTKTDWALFGYEGQTNDLKVVSSGDGGIDEMREDLNSGKIMYAFCKVLDPKTSLNKFVLINWQGEGAPLLRKGTCANHIRDVSNFLKGAHITINARTEEEVDSDIIIEKVVKSTGSVYSFKEKPEIVKDSGPVGTAYKRVIPRQEINISERDKFWQKQEEEEKRRIEEEKKRRIEERLQTEEKLRKREIEEAEQREVRMKERNDTITVQREAEKNQFCNKTEDALDNEVDDREQQEFERRTRSEVLRKQRNQEAQELISKRTIDARAVFEQHTSAGQRPKTSYLNNSANNNSITPVSPIENKEVSKVASAYSEKVSPPETVHNPAEESQFISNISNAISSLSIKDEAARNTTEINNRTELSSDISVISDSNEPTVQLAQPYVDPLYSNGDNQILEDDADLGLKAVALYDYQAADDTEISFDPGNIITHIDQIDAGWWQGLGPDGTFGLFPANYVQLLE